MLAALPTGVKIASFAEGYRKFFEIVPATNQALKWHNYHIRHEVYCRELGFEPCTPDQLETDRYDAHSIHCLVRAVATHMFVGCARIIGTNPQARDEPLPFETICGDAIDQDVLDPAQLNRTKIGEISRLAVIRQYRRRKGETEQPFPVSDDFGDSARLRLPYMTLGLYLAMLVMARTKGIDTLFMLAEPMLAGGLSHLGIELHEIGDPVEYHGIRLPTVLFVEEVVANLDSRVQPFFDMVNEEVSRALESVQ